MILLWLIKESSKVIRFNESSDSAIHTHTIWAQNKEKEWYGRVKPQKKKWTIQRIIQMYSG